jgi:transcriptional regulator
MYLPQPFAEARLPELHRLVQEHPLGLLVTHTSDGSLDANHLPFLLDEREGPFGTLLAHVARANPLWREAGDGAEVLVVFRGAQGYVSPNWYPGKQETHRYVPTWNYEAVHAHGRLRVRDDPKFVRGLLAWLTRRHEAAEPRPWKMGDAPADFLDEELSHVVGIEIAITRLEGKRKLSQNRERRDFDGAVSALRERGQEALAAAMLQARD